MINPITYFKNWCRLRGVEITLNKYRPLGSPHLKLPYKPLLKRSVMNVIRIKINRMTVAMLVSSQKNGQHDVTYVDYVWVNNRKCAGIIPETESSYYQAIYDLFMQWNENLINPTWAHPKQYANQRRQIAISINLTKEQQIEKFRRILTLYGFNINPTLTLKDVEFLRPYREKEQITNVIYTRYV